MAVNTFYRWRQKYAGMEVSDVKKLWALEDENRGLKQMVAEQALELRAGEQRQAAQHQVAGLLAYLV